MMHKKQITILITVLTIILGGIVAYMWLDTNKLSTDDDSAKQVIQAVGKHYLLPDEEPAIATVEDKTKVTSQFLNSAENGDKLLIYQEAKKVILYRPNIDKIVEVGPVSIAPAQDIQ